MRGRKRFVRTRLRPASAKRSRLLFLFLSLVILWLFRAPLLTAAGCWLDISEQPTPAEYGLVLNGDWETRPFVMAALYKAGLVEKVLISPGAPTPESEDKVIPTEHEIVREILLKRGVAEQDIILLQGVSWSTFHEANMLRDFLGKRPQPRVIIVTNDFHTRRARWTFQHVLDEQAEGFQYIGAPRERFSAENWWRSDHGAVTYLSEYAKLVYYWLRY